MKPPMRLPRLWALCLLADAQTPGEPVAAAQGECLATRVASLSDRLTSSTHTALASIEELAASNQALRQENGRLNTTIADLQGNLEQLSASNVVAQNEVAYLNATIAVLQDNIEAFRRDNLQLQLDMSSVQTSERRRAEAAEEAVADMQRTNEGLRGRVATLEGDVRRFAQVAEASARYNAEFAHVVELLQHNGITLLPTQQPTEEPTGVPTEEPTEEPWEQPTEQPSGAPSEEPTAAPSQEPTEGPSEGPTQEPTHAPSEGPTQEPTRSPTMPRRVFEGVNGRCGVSSITSWADGDSILATIGHRFESRQLCLDICDQHFEECAGVEVTPSGRGVMLCYWYRTPIIPGYQLAQARLSRCFIPTRCPEDGVWAETAASGFAAHGGRIRYCDELAVWQNSEATEQPTQQPTLHPIQPTEQPTMQPTFPGRWHLAEGEQSCAEACEAQGGRCSDRDWPATEAEGRVAFEAVGLQCDTVREVVSATCCFYTPYIYGNKCYGVHTALPAGVDRCAERSVSPRTRLCYCNDQ